MARDVTEILVERARALGLFDQDTRSDAEEPRYSSENAGASVARLCGETAEEWQRLRTEAEIPPENGAALLDEVARFYRRFVVLSPAQADLDALWTAHTHAFKAAEQTPYLSITSAEMRSGKTRLLEVMALLVARPWFTGRVTAAVLVRKVEARPTLLLDESDAAFSGEKEYAEALRALLNTGHAANGVASLCARDKGGTIGCRDFSTFCPKAIAGIGRLPDTVADRSIPIRLRRKAADEKVERFHRRRVEPEASALRARLETWTGRNVPRLRDAEPLIPEELNDRAQDAAEPLLAIADLAGGDWPQRARRALRELCAGEADDSSLGVQLLADCRTVFESRDVDRLSSVELRAALVALEESPWGETNRGKGLTVRGLARMLRDHDIVPETIWLGDGKSLKGYHRAIFKDAWSRYLRENGSRSVRPSDANTGATSLHFSKRQAEERLTDEKREIVNTDRPPDGLTDEGLSTAGKAGSGSLPAPPAATDKEFF